MAIKAFLDTNIILDIFDDKRPFHTDSTELYKLIEDGVLQAFISESVITNTDYILQKNISKKSRILLLADLVETVEILACNKSIFQKAITSNFNDLEDALLYEIALENKFSYFITNDVAAIKRRSSFQLPVIKSKDFLKLIT